MTCGAAKNKTKKRQQRIVNFQADWVLQKPETKPPSSFQREWEPSSNKTPVEKIRHPFGLD